MGGGNCQGLSALPLGVCQPGGVGEGGGGGVYITGWALGSGVLGGWRIRDSQCHTLVQYRRCVTCRHNSAISLSVADHIALDRGPRRQNYRVGGLHVLFRGAPSDFGVACVTVGQVLIQQRKGLDLLLSWAHLWDQKSSKKRTSLRMVII